MEEYSISRLARMAKVSTRTLRHYDDCGLLPSRRNRANGYRLYGPKEVDRLQQILFYRELGLGLGEIRQILDDPGFAPLAALAGHLSALQGKREQLERLIENVEKSIKALKGEMTMTDREKFEGFKEKLIEENERQYGEEIRARHGDTVIDRANAKLKGMTQVQYEESVRLSQELNDTLKAALAQGDPAGPLAQKACGLHRDWLGFYWGEGTYSKEAHRGLAQAYVSDPRFKAYYDGIAPGLAVFLRDALEVFCQ